MRRRASWGPEPGGGRRRLRLPALVLAAVLAVAPAGCGGDEGGEAPEAGRPTTLKVGVIPIVDVAPLYLGMQKGFFRAENLTIEPRLAEGGAAIIPSVISGDYQVGFSNTTSLAIAGSKGLPVQIVSQGVMAGTGPDDAYDAVIVPENSPIKRPEDLEGRTVAVNTLNNVGPLTINTALEQRSIDFRKVKYVEIPFPDMLAALDAGRVDSAFVVEPFLTQGVQGGAKALLHSYEETARNYTVATYFATKQYVARSRDVIDRFKRAMDRSLDYASKNPDEVRAIVPTYTRIPAEVAEKIALPVWKADLNEPTIQRTADLARKYGFIEEPVSLDELILRG